MKSYMPLEAHNYYTNGWVNNGIFIKVLAEDTALMLGEVSKINFDTFKQILRFKSKKLVIFKIRPFLNKILLSYMLLNKMLVCFSLLNLALKNKILSHSKIRIVFRILKN